MSTNLNTVVLGIASDGSMYMYIHGYPTILCNPMLTYDNSWQYWTFLVPRAADNGPMVAVCVIN